MLRYFTAGETHGKCLTVIIEGMPSGVEISLDEINEQLFDSAFNANWYSSMLGPVNAQIGNLSYVFCALAGGVMALSGFGGLTLGKLASFLTFNKSFNMPISQVSHQFNSIVMALAGCDRIFALLDETPETDDGYVTLVNAKDENGILTETSEHTGVWAWKCPQEDGSRKLVKLCGDVRFFDVDFAYDPEKPVLHDITLYDRWTRNL